jgi:diacylglycerol kinase family enzyme
VLLNPQAGVTRGGPSPTQVADAFAAASHTPAIVVVAGRGMVGAARDAVRHGSGVVVAGGGDGSVSAVASVLAGTGTRLGVLPLGTLNHFAKDLGLPLDLAGAVRVITGGRSTAVDVGEVNGHTFINNSSVGLYPRMVWERAQEQERGRHKWHALAVAVWRVWRRYRRVVVEVGDRGSERLVRTPFVFVGNNEYTLEGVGLGGRRRLDAGRLHVCMAPGLRRIDVARVLVAALAGRLDGIDRFESVTAAEFSISAQRRRLGVSLDGELAVLRTPLRYKVRPGALHVMVPGAEHA